MKCHRDDSMSKQEIESLERLSEDFAVLFSWLLEYCKKHAIPITSEVTPRRMLTQIFNELKELNPNLPSSYVTNRICNRRIVTPFDQKEETDGEVPAPGQQGAS